MTPQERELLTSLTDRLRKAPPQAKDREAEQMIADIVRERPDAAYLLAQTVLIQDYSLNQAQARVAELERQQAAPADAGGGSFLGGLFGGGGGRAAAPQPAPQAAANPGPGAAQAGPWGGGGGSFLRSAAATAAGVAGGALLFQGIQSLFGYGHGLGGLTSTGLAAQPGLTETVINNYYGSDAAATPTSDLKNADYTTSDAGTADVTDADFDTSSGDFGGDDFGGTDV